MRDSKMLLLLAAAVALTPGACGRGDGNLLDDPSFEVSKSKDQFGLVFARWGGWKYEGDCATSGSARWRAPESTRACSTGASGPRSG